MDDNVPHINLDFGSTDNNTSTFDMGTLGSDWAPKPSEPWGAAKSTGSAWNFGALGEAKDNDGQADTVSNNFSSSIWDTAGTKKGNKNKNVFSESSAFDFGFDNSNSAQQAEAAETTNHETIDEGPGFKVASTKNKKNKKKNGVGAAAEEPLSFLDKEQSQKEDDAGSISAWTSSDTKKKGKKADQSNKSFFSDDFASVPPPPPPPPVGPPKGSDDLYDIGTEDNSWGTFTSAKKSKKGKKDKDGSTKAEDPVVVVDSANSNVLGSVPDETALDDDWAGGWGPAATKGKKKNKDKKASALDGIQGTGLDNQDNDDVGGDNTFDFTSGNGDAFGSGKKKDSKADDKKKKSKGWESTPHEDSLWGDTNKDLLGTGDVSFGEVGHANDTSNDFLDSISAKEDTKKKDKKKSTLIDDLDSDKISSTFDSGTWSTTKKDKKGKKTKSVAGELGSAVDAVPPPPPAAPGPADETYDWGDSSFFDKFDPTKNDKEHEEKESKEKPKDKKKEKDAGKLKKSKKDAETDKVKTILPDVVDEGGKDSFSDLLSLGKSTKKKDSKKNSPVEVLEGLDDTSTVQPDAIETKSAIDDDFAFGGFSAKKGKKGKKDKDAVAPALPQVPMPPDQDETTDYKKASEAELEDDWGFASNKKDKKKKKKEVKTSETADDPRKEFEDMLDEGEHAPAKENSGDKLDITEDPVVTEITPSRPKTKKEKEKEKKEKEKEKKEKEKREKKEKKEMEDREKDELEKVKLEAEEAEKNKEDEGDSNEIVAIIEDKSSKENQKKKKKKDAVGDPNEIVNIIDEASVKDAKKKTKKKDAGIDANDTSTLLKDDSSRDTKKKAKKEIDGDPDEIVDIIDEGSPKDTKDKKKKDKAEAKDKSNGKSSKKGDVSKTKSKEVDDLFSAGDSFPDGDAVDAIDASKEVEKESPKPKKEEAKQSEGWSFWGLKSTAKKDKDASTKKSLDEPSKTDDLVKADEAEATSPAPPPESSAPPSSSKSTKAKSSAKSTVADRVKAFQGGKSSKTSTSSKIDPAADILTESAGGEAYNSLADKTQSPPLKPTITASSSKKVSSSSNKSKSTKKKEGKDAAAILSTADPAAEEPLVDVTDAGATTQKGAIEDPSMDDLGQIDLSSKKEKKSGDKKSDKRSSDKTKKKDVKATKSTKLDKAGDRSGESGGEKANSSTEAKATKKPSKEHKVSKESAAADDEAKLPTPPPEPKPAKKERARVVRDQNSWGFWGAAPKADSKKKVTKDDAVTATRSAAVEEEGVPHLSRSKSARKASARDPDKSPRSSGSEAKPGRVEAKPKTSRGMSLSNMFGAPPPPSRSKSHRQSSTVPRSKPRRTSTGNYGNLPTPPLESEKEIRVSAKAAKVMGIGEKSSRGKRQSTKSKTRGKLNNHPEL